MFTVLGSPLKQRFCGSRRSPPFGSAVLNLSSWCLLLYEQMAVTALPDISQSSGQKKDKEEKIFVFSWVFLRRYSLQLRGETQCGPGHKGLPSKALDVWTVIFMTEKCLLLDNVYSQHPTWHHAHSTSSIDYFQIPLFLPDLVIDILFTKELSVSSHVSYVSVYFFSSVFYSRGCKPLS